MPRVRHAHAQPKRYLANVDRWSRSDTAAAASRDMGECVYFVRTPDNLIKIGFTSNLDRRIRSFGCVWSDVQVAYRGTMDDEKALHERFAPYLARGNEYYFPAIEVMDFIKEQQRRICPSL